MRTSPNLLTRFVRLVDRIAARMERSHIYSLTPDEVRQVRVLTRFPAFERRAVKIFGAIAIAQPEPPRKEVKRRWERRRRATRDNIVHLQFKAHESATPRRQSAIL